MGAYREAQQKHLWKMITEQVSSPPADVALWGDSILQQVEGVVWPGSNVPDKREELRVALGRPRGRIANLGTGFDTWERSTRRLWMLRAVRPRLVFIGLGINDLSFGVPIEESAASLNFTIEYIRRYTTAQNSIILSTVLPTRPGKVPLQKWHALNRRIRHLAAAHRVKLHEAAHLFQRHSNNLSDALYVDGLHLSGEGYDVWLKGLAKAFVGVSYPAWREEEDDDLDARVQPARIS